MDIFKWLSSCPYAFTSEYRFLCQRSNWVSISEWNRIIYPLFVCVLRQWNTRPVDQQRKHTFQSGNVWWIRRIWKCWESILFSQHSLCYTSDLCHYQLHLAASLLPRNWKHQQRPQKFNCINSPFIQLQLAAIVRGGFLHTTPQQLPLLYIRYSSTSALCGHAALWYWTSFYFSKVLLP